MYKIEVMILRTEFEPRKKTNISLMLTLDVLFLLLILFIEDYIYSIADLSINDLTCL